jgi:hypothetical protein
MVTYEHSVFISYAWEGDSEEIVNKIDQSLKAKGLTIVRDKRDLGFKGSIKDFMERIGRGNCIIVVISDKYLRSPNCMFELAEIAENKEFHDRIFPIVLQDADIYDPVKRINYVKCWEDKKSELAKAMQSVDPANLQGIREDIDLYDRIRDEISGLTNILKDMNTLTPQIHQNTDFSVLYAAIEDRMKSSAIASNGQSGAVPAQADDDSDGSGGLQIGGSVNVNGGDFVAGNKNTNVGAGGVYIGGNLSGSNIVTGHNNVITAGGKSREGLFDGILKKIDSTQSLAPEDKEDLRSAIRELEAAMQGQNSVDETFLARTVRSMSRIEPKISEAVLALLQNRHPG